MLLNSQVIVYFVVLTALLYFQARAAADDKFATEGQIRRQNVEGDVLSFWGNATNWMSLFVANSYVALVAGNHAQSWSLRWFALIFGVVTVAQAYGAIKPFLKDSADQPAEGDQPAKRGTPSAFYRNGLLALPGAMQFQLFNLQTSVVVAYYLLTPRAEVSAEEVLLLTAALLLNWGVSILHPPYRAHGKINNDAWQAAYGGWAGLVLGAVYLLVFAP